MPLVAGLEVPNWHTNNTQWKNMKGLIFSFSKGKRGIILGREAQDGIVNKLAILSC